VSWSLAWFSNMGPCMDLVPVCQFELKTAAVDAVALHQESGDGVIEQLGDRIRLGGPSPQSAFPTPCITQGRCGCSVGWTAAGTRIANGRPPPAGSLSFSSGLWARDHFRKPLIWLALKKMCFINRSFYFNSCKQYVDHDRIFTSVRTLYV
jgi:hypothetical protein